MCKGKLYIGTIGRGTSHIVLDELTELTVGIDTAAGDEIDYPVLLKAEPTEITFEAKVDKLTLLSILTGVKVTNNWLKLHGGIMRRKRRISNG